ncbi:BnaCnng14530D [Brassica napus]|uniref:BnaCnng14530D protein n=1 Tax=Brassica napus TaxID=3708 RepID=A0A078IBQ1_BRANA|nr:BnaCnng14530D [Brassica napus]
MIGIDRSTIPCKVGSIDPPLNKVKKVQNPIVSNPGSLRTSPEDVVHHRFRFRRRKRHNHERTRGRQEISENIHGQENYNA